MTTLRRTTSLLAVIAMLLTLTALPAFAVAQGSATITTGDLLSGQGGNVNVRITNDASAGTLGLGAGSAIDAFVIEVPQDLVQVAPADVSLPSGWTGGYDTEIGFIFGEAEDGSELAPGSSLDVGIGVTAVAIPDDRTRGFTTSVSDNGGLTLSSAGSPTVTSRILEITDTVLNRPSDATNENGQQVTAGQDNATFSVTVVNHGTQSRTVEADVVRATGGSSVDTTAGSGTIAAGDTGSIDVAATFGNPGSLNVDGTAASTNSTANPLRAESITVQAAFTAALVPDSLQPTALVPGTTTDIQYRIDKTAGAQPVTADATLSFCGISVTEPQSFDAANGEKTVLFSDVVIPADLPNGDCTTDSTIVGIDANGATVDLDLDPGILTIDDLLPSIDLTLDVGETDVPDTTAATTNGRAITYSGSIELSGDNGLCDDCTITEAVLVPSPNGDPLPMNVTNTDGTLSGSESFTFPAGTTSAIAEITVERDTTGAIADDVSNTIIVDLVAPDLDGPGETRRGETSDQITIDLGDDGDFVDVSESTAGDWSVEGYTVSAVDGSPSAGSASQVILTLDGRLADNATPAVTYSPALLFAGVIHDRVSLEAVEQTVQTVDRIAPVAPVIETVNGLPPQDGEFYINDSTPEVSLSSLGTGTLLELYYDTNDDGVPQATERVESVPVDGDTATVTLNDLGNVDASHSLIARLKDDAGNLGELGSEVLNLDFTLPKITDFSVSGQEVTVTFDEPVVRGRDAAFDWTVQATQDGTTAHRTVTQVVSGADSTQRVLTVNSASWDSSAAGAEVLGVRYKFRGAEGERYEDRATNLFGDVLFTKE